MSKKKIVLSIVFSVFAVVNVVLYLIFKEQYLDTLKYIYSLLNEPLPIVGVTTFAVLIFLWRVIITARYGEGAVNKIKAEYQKQKEELKSENEEKQKVIENQDKKINFLYNFIIQLCNIIPNKKVKELGKGLDYGKEGINDNTEKE